MSTGGAKRVPCRAQPLGMRPVLAGTRPLALIPGQRKNEEASGGQAALEPLVLRWPRGPRKRWLQRSHRRQSGAW